MKSLIYLLALVSISFTMASCDTDTEATEVQKPYTYSDLYYQNLRDYKASDHSIAWGWFADYTQSHSLALRFLGLPDSLDICSLWGGLPKDEAVWEELRFVQKVKGTKMVCPTIIRIEDKVAYGDQQFYQLFQDSYDSSKGTDDERLAMRHKALEMYADYLMDPIFENNLDGIDLDYEPEGDRLSGDNMIYFCEYIGKKIGPKSINPEKIFCIDFYGQYPPDECVPYVNYLVNQTYGGSPRQLGNFPVEKCVYTENVGDNWQNSEAGQLLNYARWQPTTGRKGGFGAFYMHRDYNIGNENPYPYKRFREAIQIQNPAIY